MRNPKLVTRSCSRVLYRVSIVRLFDTSGEPDDYWRWSIPVFFRDRESAIAAAVKSAARRQAQYGGEWSLEVTQERVSIV